MPHFDLFKPDTEITNLIILEAIKVTNAMYTTRYAVRYLCCGEEGTLSHRRIRERLSDDSTLCLNCNRKSSNRRHISEGMRKRAERQSAPLEPGFHGWAPPSSATRGRS